MNIKASVIESFSRWLFGGVPFASARRLVEQMDGKKLSGTQKFALVKDEFIRLGYDLAGWAVNLIIELAVAWMKARK